MKGDWLQFAALCALCIGVVLLFDYSRQQVGIDFYQFWAVSQVASEKGAGIYDEQGRREMAQAFQQRAVQNPTRERMAAGFRQAFEPTATPLLYTCFVPLGYMDYEDAQYWYSIVIMGCALAAVVLMCMQFGYGWPATIAVSAAVFWLFHPFLNDLAVGNVNALQLVLLSILMLLESRRAMAHQLASGMLVALMVLFKPNVACVAILLWASYAFRRDWRGCMAHGLGALAGAAAGIVFSSAHFGSPDAWFAWLAAGGRMRQWFDLSVEAGNYSFARILQETLGVDLWLPLAAAGMLLGLAAVWAAGRKASDAAFTHTRLLAIGAGCVLPLVASPLAWAHYFLLLLPALLYTARPVTARTCVPVVIAGVLALHGLLGHADIVVPPFAVACIYAGSATGLLAVIGARLLQVGRLPAGQMKVAVRDAARP